MFYNKEDNIYRKNILKTIVSLSVPTVIEELLSTFLQYVDTAMVGQLGEDAAASVSVTTTVSWLISSIPSAVSVAVLAMIAKAIGSSDDEKIQRISRHTALIVPVIGVFLGAVSVVLSPFIPIWMGAEISIRKQASLYFFIISLSMLFRCSGIIFGAALRATTDTKTPLYINFAANTLNAVLNYLLIYKADMGVTGAAIATVASQIVSTYICFRKLRTIEFLKLSEDDFRNDASLNLTLFRDGIPMALMNSITAVGCMVVQYFVNGLGVAHTTAYSACSKFVNLFMQPGCTAGFAMSSFTSQNYGAGNYKRIREGLHVCVKIAFISYVLLGAVMLFAPTFLAKIILSTDEPIKLASEFLPICGVTLIFVDLIFIFRSGCQAMGRPLVPMISGVVEMIMRIMTIYLLVDKLGFKATALAESAAWFSAFALNSICFKVLLSRAISGRGGRQNSGFTLHRRKPVHSNG